MKKLIGHINLYSFPTMGINKFCHWSGSIHETKEEALKYKDKREKCKIHTLGKVYVEIEKIPSKRSYYAVHQR